MYIKDAFVLFYLFNFPFSSLNKLRDSSADKEYTSSEVGVVFLDEINDWFWRFQAMESMDELEERGGGGNDLIYN